MAKPPPLRTEDQETILQLFIAGFGVDNALLRQAVAELKQERDGLKQATRLEENRDGKEVSS